MIIEFNEIEVCCYRDFRFRKSPTCQNYCDQFSRNHICVQMVKFSYTRFGKWDFTTVREKGLVVYDPKMMSCEPLCDGDVKKGTETLTWVEQSVCTNGMQSL